jgi:predicted RNase H-like HicB family nuclease
MNAYTVMVRKSKLQYVAICLELNVSACGDTLVEVEGNLGEAIQEYLADVKEHPETHVEPIGIAEVIEFLRDTEPEWHATKGKRLLRPFEIHEVPAYA